MHTSSLFFVKCKINFKRCTLSQRVWTTYIYYFTELSITENWVVCYGKWGAKMASKLVDFMSHKLVHWSKNSQVLLKICYIWANDTIKCSCCHCALPPRLASHLNSRSHYGTFFCKKEPSIVFKLGGRSLTEKRSPYRPAAADLALQ